MKRISGVYIIIAAVFSVVALACTPEGEIKSSVPSSEAVLDDLIKDKKEDDTLNSSFEEKYSDKDYIFLLHDTEVIVEKDYTYKTRIHEVIKILQEDGKSLGEMTFGYDRSKENLIKIEAFSVTPDGKKHPATKIQDFAVSEDQVYSDFREKVLTIPEVNIGTVIELKVLKKTKGKVIPNSYWDEVHLEVDVPVKRLRKKYVFPKSAGIQYKEFNVTYKPGIQESNNNIIYQWDIEDVYYGLWDEDFEELPTIENLKNVVEFSSLKSWSEVSDWLFEAVNKKLKITPEIEVLSKGLFKGKKSTKEKVRAAIEYLRDNFRYVSMSFGDNTHEPHPTDEIFANKYADCKDISLLLMAMLKTAGIDSHLVLTNEETDITDPRHDLPMLDLFNHAIVLVNDPAEGNYYVDPLLKGYDIGEFSANYQGAYTFIVNADGGRFDRFPIFDEKKAYDTKNTSITIQEDGSAIIESEYVPFLDYAVWFRQEYKSRDNKKKESFIQEKLVSLANGGELLAREIRGLEDRYGEISIQTKMKIEDEYPIISDLIIIDEAGFERDSDFTYKERKDPIFQRVNSLVEETRMYKFPENFQVLHLPEDIELDIGMYTFTRSFSVKENEITVKETQRNKRMLLGADKYQQVKKFYDALPAKSRQRIVLQRTRELD